MRRLVWIHAGRKPMMLVLSWRGSYLFHVFQLSACVLNWNVSGINGAYFIHHTRLYLSILGIKTWATCIINHVTKELRPYEHLSSCVKKYYELIVQFAVIIVQFCFIFFVFAMNTICNITALMKFNVHNYTLVSIPSMTWGSLTILFIQWFQNKKHIKCSCHGFVPDKSPGITCIHDHMIQGLN
jgi:hypothetical protein